MPILMTDDAHAPQTAPPTRCNCVARINEALRAAGRIEADELQDVIRSTNVNVRWDSLGKSGLIVYPC